MSQPVKMRREAEETRDRQTPKPGEATFPAADAHLDTVGLYCPVPIIKTQARIRTMQAGEVLEIASDDRVILLDMPAWCRSTGHEYLGSREEAGEILLYVRKIVRVPGKPETGGKRS